MGNESTSAEMHCSESENGEGITCKLSIEENGKKAMCTVTIAGEDNGNSFGLKASCSGDKNLMKKLEQQAQNIKMPV